MVGGWVRWSIDWWVGGSLIDWLVGLVGVSELAGWFCWWVGWSIDWLVDG